MRKDFLTPPNEGSGVTCRTLRTPSEKEWLGVFNSALLTLLDAWRWEQVNDTDLTPDQAVAICQEILNDFWSSSECDSCLQPSGQPFMSFDDFGFFKMLEGGEWVNPTGDYAVPPIPPRETGTDEEKRCLAAANCANCLKILYEQLADDYAADRTTAEAISNLATAIALLIGAWLGLAIVAIIAIYRIMFQVVYETIEFVTADYWTTDFDQKLQCVLFDCSSVDVEGVVTFDLECVIKGIAESTSVLDNPAFVLLFGQVQTMLTFLGADGLNAAGGTTAITSADCSACVNWCREYNLYATDAGFVLLSGEPRGAWDTTDAWHAIPYSGYTLLQISVNLSTYSLDAITLTLDADLPGGSGGGLAAYWNGVLKWEAYSGGVGIVVPIDVTADPVGTLSLNFIANVPGGTTGSVSLYTMTLQGHEPPIPELVPGEVSDCYA